MQNRIALLFTVLLFAAGPQQGLAQALYRCGNTFSQTPCANDATRVGSLPSSADSGAAAAPKGAQLCEQLAPRSLGLKDPQSAVVNTTRIKTEVIQYAGQPMVAVKYHMLINAKNQYGAYEGERAYTCFLSEDERRVLKIGAATP